MSIRASSPARPRGNLFANVDMPPTRHRDRPTPSCLAAVRARCPRRFWNAGVAAYEVGVHVEPAEVLHKFTGRAQPLNRADVAASGPSPNRRGPQGTPRKLRFRKRLDLLRRDLCPSTRRRLHDQVAAPGRGRIFPRQGERTQAAIHPRHAGSPFAPISIISKGISPSCCGPHPAELSALESGCGGWQAVRKVRGPPLVKSPPTCSLLVRARWRQSTWPDLATIRPGDVFAQPAMSADL